MRRILQSLMIAVIAMTLFSCKKATSPIPHLLKKGEATQLIVDGKPFLVLGGELHNSSASSAAYMESVWPVLKKMNLNTVLAVVSWDQFEPEEGRFDYSLTDYLIQGARKNDMRLIILWFGSWKNGNSTYTPQWVKKDLKRFPRVKDQNGSTLEILSPFGDQACNADAKALAALMKHIREVDSVHRTVIMVQVENEVGVHSDSRDRSELAEKAFTQPVPAQLLDYLQQHRENLVPELKDLWATTQYRSAGTWEEVFGAGAATEEIFMAWQYANYINEVTESGKKEYPLPMYVNAWLVQPQSKKPGDYPSGGPNAHLLDIWRAGGPAIDFLAPDIYLPDFVGTVQKFSRSGNPLFIPETRAGKRGAGNAMLAIAQYDAMGFSPFGIDGARMDQDTFPKVYSLLSQLSPLILQKQGTDSLAAVALNQANPYDTIKMGVYDLHFSLLQTRRYPHEWATSGYAMAAMLDKNEFIVSGNDVQVTFIPNDSDSIAGFLAVEEGVFEDGKWIPGRLLNGDETQLSYDLGQAALERLSREGLKLPTERYSIQKALLYNYK